VKNLTPGPYSRTRTNGEGRKSVTPPRGAIDATVRRSSLVIGGLLILPPRFTPRGWGQISGLATAELLSLKLKLFLMARRTASVACPLVVKLIGSKLLNKFIVQAED
jgi:hypothetical protein